MENLPLISLPKQLSAEKGTIEGAVVPVVFGEVKVSGNILWMGNIDQTSNKSKLSRYGDATKAYISEAWYSICMGFNFLLKIFANDKQLLEGVDYDSTKINEGLSSYAPTISPISNSVIVGDTGKIYYSINKKDYTEVSVSTANFNDVVFANNQFMAVGNSGKIFISFNGIEWVDKSPIAFAAENFMSICYGSGKYVVATKTKLLSSSDGNIWTSVFILPYDATWEKVIYGLDRFMLVSDSIYPVYYSLDGATWYAPMTPPEDDYFIYSICFIKTKGRFVLGGDTGRVAYSDNGGNTWTAWYSTITEERIYAICEGADGILFAAANLDVLRSADSGLNWTIVFSVLSDGRRKIIYDGLFLYAFNALMTLVDISATGAVKTWTEYAITGLTKGNNVAIGSYQNFEFVTKLRGIAHIFFSRMVGDENQDQRVVLNSDNTTPDMKFVVRNLATELPDGELYKYASDGTTPIKFVGMNPAVVVWDILYNRQWGLNVPDALISVPQAAIDIFTSAAAKASNRIYGINLILDQLTSAKEVLDKIRDMTDIYCSMDFATGKISIKSMYGDFPAVATLTDDDLNSCSIKEQSWENVFNDFEGEYIEPRLNYAKRSICVRNDAAIELAGGITKKKKIDLTYFIDQDIASVRLNEIMQRESRPRITISCASDHILAMVNPGDTVRLNTTEYAINSLFTVIQKSASENNDLLINIDLQQRIYDQFDLNSFSAMSSMGTLPAYQGTQTKTTLFFPKFKDRSELTKKILTSTMKVAFTPGQGINENAINSGILTIGTDYAFYNSGADYAIALSPKWSNAIFYNSLGLLSVDVWD